DRLWRSGRRFHRGDAVLHRLLHLLEGAHLDLAHALARHAELGGKVFERHRLVRQAPRLQHAAFAVVGHFERPRPPPAAGVSTPWFPAITFPWLSLPPASRPCHSPLSPSSRIGALSEASPPRRRFMSITSCSVTPSRFAMVCT